MFGAETVVAPKSLLDESYFFSEENNYVNNNMTVGYVNLS